MLGLTCTNCHGGNPLPGKTGNDPAEFERAKRAATYNRASRRMAAKR